MVDMGEIMDSPGFWILGGLGVTAELIGYTVSRNQGWVVMPFWQLAVMVLGTLIAAAFFALRD